MSSKCFWLRFSDTHTGNLTLPYHRQLQNPAAFPLVFSIQVTFIAAALETDPLGLSLPTCHVLTDQVR